MIIKGASRAGPKQLATHLGRRDTNERVEVLELQSPAGSLREAFRDWQTLSEGTKGRFGLYHANIDPAETYTMTADQWGRCVDVLEEELGLAGQPRAVVLHEKHGRQHIHVVWARTDLDTMTLKADSHNYLAHERASQRLELEFGHEIVPGKHAKRDRERQPDMPDAALDHGEWQQGESAALDHKARKAQIMVLYQASDDGLAFTAALEAEGYTLARGDKRDFVILDAAAKVHSLGRQLPGVSAKDLRAFMAAIDPARLPSVQEARAAIRAAPVPEPQPPTPEPPPVPQPDHNPETATRLDALRRMLDERHSMGLRAQAQRHAHEVETLQQHQQAEAQTVIEALARDQAQQAVAARIVEEDRWEALRRTVREALSPDAKTARLDQERRQAEELARASEQGMVAMLAEMEARHRAGIDALVARQAEALIALQRRHDAEIANRLAEAAHAIEREEERALELERQREIERQRQEARSRDGPDGDGRAR